MCARKVAALGVAFLCADLSVTPHLRDDHAHHIANWLDILKGDKKGIFTAAAAANRATDFLHGLQPKSEAVQPGRGLRQQPRAPRRSSAIWPSGGSAIRDGILGKRCEVLAVLKRTPNRTI